MKPLCLFIPMLFLSPSAGLIAQGETSSPAAAAKKKSDRISFMDWMQERDDVTFFLESDFEQYKRNRRKQEYQPAAITIEAGEAPILQEILIRPRGKFRCMYCDVPPMKIKFAKEPFKEAGFRKWNELKLVLPFRKGSQYEELLYKEYLVYRLYNLLTDRSFRVKLIKLRLRDNGTGQEYETMPAFLVEDEKEVASRLDAETVDTLNLNPATFSPADYTRFQVFEFMIGNTDWIPLTGHNMALLHLDAGPLAPVPYDFDFCGLVSAPYAVPKTETGLSSVRERLFMGNNKTEAELNAVFDQFREQHAAMTTLIEEFELLDKKTRKKMISYLDEFFRIIDDPRQVRRYFIDQDPFLPGIY